MSLFWQLVVGISGLAIFAGKGAKDAGEGVEKASNGGVKLAFSAAVLAGLWYWFKGRK